MDTATAAIIVASIAAAASVFGPSLVARQTARRVDRAAAQQATHLAKIASSVARVEHQTDGSLTAAYRAEAAAVQAQVVAMRKPAADTQAAIRTAEERLRILNRRIADREETMAQSWAQEPPREDQTRPES